MGTTKVMLWCHVSDIPLHLHLQIHLHFQKYVHVGVTLCANFLLKNTV